MSAREFPAVSSEISGAPPTKSVSLILIMSVSVSALLSGVDLSVHANALMAISSPSDLTGARRLTARMTRNGRRDILGASLGAAPSIWSGVTRPCNVNALKTDSGQDVSKGAFLSTAPMVRNSTSS